MLERKKIMFKYKYILYFLIMFPFIRQRTMEDFPNWLVSIYRYGSLISTSFIFIYVFYNKNNIKYMKKIFWVIAMMTAYVLITAFISIRNIPLVFTCITLMAMAMFTNLELQKNPKDFVKVLTFIYVGFILINNILVLIFPQGFYDAYLYHNGHLLGDDNAIIFVALPGMVVMCINSLMNYGKITKFTWFNILFCEFVFIRLWAASAMIAFGAFIAVVYI